MPVRVRKIADIIGGAVVFDETRRSRQGDAVVILINCEAATDPDPKSAWNLNLVIGTPGRRIVYEMPPILSRTHSGETPVFVGSDASLIYFRDRLFMTERPAVTDSDSAEAVLRVKKAVYDEEAEIFRLRDAVANLEAAIDFEKSGQKRHPIPEDVKLSVWVRDGGRCIRCGSRQELHFDHLIPFAKGGGNSEENIQILCRRCNQQKSDKITII